MASQGVWGEALWVLMLLPARAGALSEEAEQAGVVSDMLGKWPVVCRAGLLGVQT